MNRPHLTSPVATFHEDVEISGHIIDSLILPKVLDQITARGGAFHIKRIAIGHERQDPSFALVEVRADNAVTLQQILQQIADHGALPTTQQDAHFVPADIVGAFPEGFYSTTNQRTQVRVAGQWIPVDQQEMDCGIVLDPQRPAARCLAMTDVRVGDLVLVGHAGIRVLPEERSLTRQPFEFMGSHVSIEKPKTAAIREVAREMLAARARGGKILVVAGPAVIHTGSGEHLTNLIRQGFVQKLFAGNALATHDIEQALFGTSLGVHLDRGTAADAGHEHHLRAINRIRRAGGIRAAVEAGLLTQGVMFACVQEQVEFLLAGSIRDDGPLPEVITDSLTAQQAMRAALPGVELCLMIATTLHSVAVGNLLPAWVKVVCVDINLSTVIKLADRGSFQSVGLVTDVEPFFRELLAELAQLQSTGAA